MKKSIELTAILSLCSLILFFGCQKQPEKKTSGVRKLSVVSSLFPVYEFARQVGGDRTDVVLLLPPGTEPHSFDPRPGDILTLNRADLFFYTNIYMEPWAGKILNTVSNTDLLAIDTSSGVGLAEAHESSGHSEDLHTSPIKGGGRHEHGSKDPHMWLDPQHAIKMVENIRDGFIRKDPENAELYRQNAAAYVQQLQALDDHYTSSLSGCNKKVFVTGGHFTFGYLARRYGLSYVSAYGLSPNSEPTPGSLAAASRTLRENGLRHLFFEELITPRIAETIAKETGAELLMLHGAHNISRDDFEKGTTFMSLMEENLRNLRTGLQCR